MNNLIPYETILEAKRGNSEAMKAILRHYEGYIVRWSTRTQIDSFGNTREFLDEDIRQNIESALMLSIIFRFDPCRLPDDERLEEKLQISQQERTFAFVRSCGEIPEVKK